jgi:predicted transcriptional regulator
MGSMIKVLEEAIEKVKKLPKDRQAYAAEILEDIVADADGEIFPIPEEHMAGVLEGLGQAQRGEFASDEEMEALWKKWRL